MLRIYHPNIKLTRERSRNWQASWYPANKVYSKVKMKVYKRQTPLVYSEINVFGCLWLCCLLTSILKEMLPETSLWSSLLCGLKIHGHKS